MLFDSWRRQQEKGFSLTRAILSIYVFQIYLWPTIREILPSFGDFVVKWKEVDICEASWYIT